MTRRQDIVLGATIAVWAVALALAYLGACYHNYDSAQCGKVGGCEWMNGT